jgi:hypothetical protein
VRPVGPLVDDVVRATGEIAGSPVVELQVDIFGGLSLLIRPAVCRVQG